MLQKQDASANIVLTKMHCCKETHFHFKNLLHFFMTQKALSLLKEPGFFFLKTSVLSFRVDFDKNGETLFFMHENQANADLRNIPVLVQLVGRVVSNSECNPFTTLQPKLNRE